MQDASSRNWFFDSDVQHIYQYCWLCSKNFKNWGGKHPSLSLRYMKWLTEDSRADGLAVQVTGIFRGGMATFLRESLGNAVFFTVYENVRHFMHLQLKDASRDHKGLADLGVGIISGGLGGIAVSRWFIRFPDIWFLFFIHFALFSKLFCLKHPVLVYCFACGCGKNHDSNQPRSELLEKSFPSIEVGNTHLVREN